MSLNPNLPIAWTLSACANVYNGDHRTAVIQTQMAASLSPSDPHVFFVEHVEMLARLFLKDLETADMLAARVLERKPGHASGLRVRLAILGHLGQIEQAEQCLAQLRIIDPDVTVQSIVSIPPLRPHDVAFYAED